MPDIKQSLIEQILNAKSERRKLNIVGRGSKKFLGRQVSASELSLAEHEGIVSYKPTELVLTARGGTSIAAIDQMLLENGQMLASDPPKFGGDGSIGGSLACNLSGPGRPWSGSLRDSVLGVKIINGSGDVLNFGGQVMKNVAGYDVSRLQAGAMGCLGVISEVSLKVMPRPEVSATVCVQLEQSSEALKVINSLCGTSIPITAACWVGGQQYIRFQGAGSAVEKAIKQIQSTYSAAIITDDAVFWEGIRDHSHAFFHKSSKLWRLSVNATAELKTDTNALIDWGGAQRWVHGDGTLETMASMLDGGLGEASLLRGGNGSDEVFHPMDDVRQTLHKRLKSTFDPDHLFNPGRLYEWL